MKKYILIALVVLAGAVLWIGLNLNPGSYANTEKYTFNVPEEDLIKNIDEFRNANPSLKVPEAYAKREGKKGNNDHWHHFYLFYTEEQEILNCWVRAKSLTTTEVALVSIMDRYGKWKLLDRDFNPAEKKVQEKKFEERFIKRLKKVQMRRE